MKFSDQKISYYDADQDATMWLSIQDYIKKFPDKIGPRKFSPGKDLHRLFSLPHSIDISFVPCAKERATYCYDKVTYVYILRAEGVVLDVPDRVTVTTTTDIDWGF